VRLKLEDAITESLGRLFRAGSIMTHPPICLSEDRPLSEAMDMMARYGLHAILAEDSNGKVSGIIGEQNVSKAMYHGLTGYPVKDFMVTDFVTVSTDANFYEIKKLIVDQRQRILPVLGKDAKPLGVITRTDLLHILAAEAGGEDGRASYKTPFDRNISTLMQERLPAPISSLLKDMGKMSTSFNVSLYLVGGTVRDLIMLKPIKDLDLTVTGEITGFIMELHNKYPGSELKNHPRFKTATLTLAEGIKLDFSSARVEYYEYPGAYPVVRNASIQLDLQRRDFTINTLAVSLNPSEYGKLLDYYKGYQDIKDGLIRVLHSLSFVEDPSRVFRAVRFESRLGFKISKMTGALITNAVSGGFIKNLSLRRLLSELRQICEDDEPGAALDRLNSFGLLKSFSPDLKVTRKHLALFKKVDRVKDWYKLTFSGKFSPIWMVYFLSLCFELDDDTLMQLVEELDQSKKIMKALVLERPSLEKVINSSKKYPENSSLKPSEVDAIFGNFSLPGVLYIMARVGEGPLARSGATFLTIYSRMKPEITTSDDLISLGFKSGSKLNETLEVIKHARLDGIIGNCEEEKAYVRQYLESKDKELEDIEKKKERGEWKAVNKAEDIVEEKVEEKRESVTNADDITEDEDENK
jgi:tRNA nucleotidyltransferase (CCA-adding enzyme)